MPFVMLRRTWPGNFRRTIQTGKGESKQIVFTPGEPVELTKKEIEAIGADLGVSLLPVEIEANGKIRIIDGDVEPAEVAPPLPPAPTPSKKAPAPAPSKVDDAQNTGG